MRVSLLFSSFASLILQSRYVETLNLMSTKVQVKENGYIVTNLPISGTKVTLRPPKGKDLKAIDIASRSEDVSNVGIMMLIGSLLAVEPVLSLEEVEDMDAEDVAALGVALGNFRALRKS